jgi:hypothetical protein
MPLAGLHDHMMCPRGGNRRVNPIFEPPPVARRAQGFTATVLNWRAITVTHDGL